MVFFRRRPGGDLNNWALVSMGGTCCWLIAINLSPVPYPLPNLLVWLLSGLALSRYTTTARADRRVTAGGAQPDYLELQLEPA